MEQGAGEREEIEKFLALGQMFDIDSAKGDLFATEQRNDLGKMRAGTDENGDAIFAAGSLSLGDAREMLLENVKDVESFLLLSVDNICQAGPMICGADYLRVNPQGRLWGFGGRGGGSASERDRGRAGRSLFRANEVEDGVEGVGEACMGTEVDGELHRLTANGSAGGADAMIANVGKELDLRLAEQIDRLHGIANEEAGTVLAGIPGGEESGNQLVLSARRILELVNEQMAEIAGNVDDALRRFLENEECGEVQLGEVHLIVFSEDHAEFGYGLAQD
ncbi:MAG: hypothetical protein WBX06_17670, partial [Acidobacteriaceae bacterium]